MSGRGSKKSIAIVHDALIEWGGAEKVLDEILNVFPHATVYTSVSLQKVEKKLKNLSNRKIKTSWLQLYWNQRFPRRIIQLLSPFIWNFSDLKHVDVVLIHSGFYLSKLSATQLRKGRQQIFCYLITPPKNVYSWKFNWESILYPYYLLLKVLDKKSNEHISNFLSVSKAVNQRLMNMYQKEGVVLYPPCFDENIVVKTKKRKNKKTFGYFGRLSAEKNLGLLIETFKTLPDLKLEIIGDGADRGRLEKNTPENISFLGYLEGKKMTDKISQWNASIHPAIEDDFPLSVIEALRLAVPVICHSSGGVTDYIKEGVNGFFFQENTIGSLRTAILNSQNTLLSSVEMVNSVRKYSTQQFRSNIKKLVYEKN